MKKQNQEAVKLLRDLFACARHMQNKLHGINGQLFALESMIEKKDPQKIKMCMDNINSYTRYIYDGDEYKCFPRVDEVLKMTRDYLVSIDAFGEFNDYTGFTKAGKGGE